MVKIFFSKLQKTKDTKSEEVPVKNKSIYGENMRTPH